MIRTHHPVDTPAQTNDANRWVRRAFAIGAGSIVFVLLLAFVDALFAVIDGPQSLVDRSPGIGVLGQIGAWTFVASTFVLWLKAWVLVFPRPTMDTGHRPVAWFLLLTVGFLITPWYVIYRAMKNGAV